MATPGSHADKLDSTAHGAQDFETPSWAFPSLGTRPSARCSEYYIMAWLRGGFRELDGASWGGVSVICSPKVSVWGRESLLLCGYLWLEKAWAGLE